MTGRSVIARGLADFRWASLGSHLREPRFWVVQTLVVGIAIGHGIFEYLESTVTLGRFAEGLLHLPAPTNVIPVLVAGLWYGVEGAVLTGLFAGVLGIPNLTLFHRTDFSWLGEGLTYLGVVLVAVLVGVMAEREAALKLRSEATDRRLATAREIAGVLSNHDETHRLILAVLDRLRGAGYCATGFAPVEGFMPSPVISGPGGDSSRLQTVVAGMTTTPEAPLPEGIMSARVDTGDTIFGTLLVDCSPGRGGPEDDTTLALVAKELGVALDNISMRLVERADLERYARAVTVAQEAERQRIARELHDETAQSVIVLTRGLGRLADEGDDALTREEAGRLREVARTALRSIRSTIWALRPPLLDDLGLRPAIESLAEQRAAQGGCRVDVAVVGSPRRLDPDVELAAYRTTQEALSNVDRHSGADHATVTLEFTTAGLRLEVEDDGLGFDPRLPGSDGLGLAGMRERAEIVGGSLEIVSEIDMGTRVVLSVPG